VALSFSSDTQEGQRRRTRESARKYRLLRRHGLCAHRSLPLRGFAAPRVRPRAPTRRHRSSRDQIARPTLCLRGFRGLLRASVTLVRVLFPLRVQAAPFWPPLSFRPPRGHGATHPGKPAHPFHFGPNHTKKNIKWSLPPGVTGGGPSHKKQKGNPTGFGNTPKSQQKGFFLKTLFQKMVPNIKKYNGAFFYQKTPTKGGFKRPPCLSLQKNHKKPKQQTNPHPIWK